MAKRSVNVLIKARDEASHKFLRIGGAAKIMGKMLKGVGSTIKTAFVTALKAAKYAAVGLGVAMVGATYKAIKQQAAELELASALKVTNQYSEAAMQRLKEQAAAIQDVTTYGDEYIMTLQRMAVTLGVTEEKATDAAKAAIALHAGFGGGRGKPEIFLRYYIDTLRGTGTSLASYVGELRKAKTEEEKMLVLQKAMAKGWDVAKSKAEHAAGAISQMKNKLGDVAEFIGRPFLPAITSSAKAVTRWAKENEANIAWWANKTFSYVTLVKDVFVEVIEFMKKDWKAGFKFAFDAALIEFRTFGKSLLILSKKIFADLRNQMTVSLQRSSTEWLMRQGAEAEYLRKHRGRRIGGLYEKPLTFELIRKSKEYAARQMEAVDEAGVLETMFPRKKTTSWETIGDLLAEEQKKAMKEITELMPAEFKKGVDKAFAKLEKRLKELGEMPGPAKPAAAAGAGAPEPFSIGDILTDSLKNIRSEIVRKLAPREAGYLTFDPGKRFDYEQQTAKNTGSLIKSFKELLRTTKEMAKNIARMNRRTPVGSELVVSNFP